MPAYSPLQGVESSSLCVCGCGGFTLFSKYGEPNRYIHNHHLRRNAILNPNPEGICGCGCGATTSRAKKTTETVTRGYHLPWLPGHSKRKAPFDYAVNEDGCWIWQRALNRAGYGQAWVDGQVTIAHRAYYEHHHGPIPYKHQVHHTCRVRACVNPEHLEALTARDHLRLHANRPR